MMKAGWVLLLIVKDFKCFTQFNLVKQIDHFVFNLFEIGLYFKLPGSLGLKQYLEAADIKMVSIEMQELHMLFVAIPMDVVITAVTMDVVVKSTPMDARAKIGLDLNFPFFEL